MATRNIAEIKNSNDKITSKPIILLQENVVIGESMPYHAQSKVKKCMCTECNKLFDLDGNPSFVLKDHATALFPRGDSNLTLSADIYSSHDMDAIDSIECPDCHSKGLYMSVKRNSDGSWHLPYQFEERSLSEENGVFTDKCVYSATQIDGQYNITSGSLVMTETIDFSKKSRQVLCEHNNDGRYTKYSFEKKPVESEDMLSNKICTKAPEKMSEKETYTERYRAMDPKTGHYALGRCMINMRTNPLLGSDVMNPVVQKEFRTNPRCIGAVIDTENNTVTNTVCGLPDTTEFVSKPDESSFRIFEARRTVRPHEAIEKYESAKRDALMAYYKEKLNLPSKMADVFFDSSKNNLFARSHKLKQTELTEGASDKFSAVYTDLVVKYPAVFEMACIYTKRDISNRAKKDVLKRNENVQPTRLPMLMDEYIDSLPDTAIARHFRENMFMFASQLYACDDNIRKECHKADSAKDLFDTLKFYAFGPEIENAQLGSRVIIPEQIQKNAKKNNISIEKQTLVQNDADCVNEFLRHPIGFANTKYTLQKTFGKSLSEEDQVIILNEITKDIGRKSGVSTNPKVEEGSPAYYRTSLMIHDYTISPLSAEEKKAVKSTIDLLSPEEIARIYTDDIGRDLAHNNELPTAVTTYDAYTGRNTTTTAQSTLGVIKDVAAIRETFKDGYNCELIFDKESKSDNSVLNEIHVRHEIRRNGIESAYNYFASKYGDRTEDVVNGIAREMLTEDRFSILKKYADEHGMDAAIADNKALISKLNLTDPAKEIAEFEPKHFEINIADMDSKIKNIRDVKRACDTNLRAVSSFSDLSDTHIELTDNELASYCVDITHDNESYRIRPILDVTTATNLLNASGRFSRSDLDEAKGDFSNKKLIACDIISEYMPDPIGTIFINNESNEEAIYVTSTVCDIDFIEDVTKSWADSVGIDKEIQKSVGYRNNEISSTIYGDTHYASKSGHTVVKPTEQRVIPEDLEGNFNGEHVIPRTYL